MKLSLLLTSLPILATTATLSSLPDGEVHAKKGVREGRSLRKKTERHTAAASDEINEFVPLTCNADLTSDDCYGEDATTLSSIIDSTMDGEEAKIECGVCAIVDVSDGSLLNITAGLNVEGMLYFPSESNLVIETIHIFIQGILKIDPPNTGNTVRIRMIGTEDQYLFPHEENAYICDSDTGCDVGKKVIAVAGGRLEIKALADATCPAWTHIQSILPVESNTGDKCPLDHDIVKGDGTFESPWVGGDFWHHDGGSTQLKVVDDPDVPNNKYLVQTNRRCSFTGLKMNLDMACASIPDETKNGVWYKFSVRYKVVGSGNTSKPLLQISSRNIGQCPEAIVDEWVVCEKKIQLMKEEVNGIQVFVLQMQSESTLDVYYDDLHMTAIASSNQFVVESKAAECWGARPDDEILLISSEEFSNSDQTVHRIMSVDTINGTITLSPDTPIDKEYITMDDDPRFAAEVAWLSRSVIFEADLDGPSNLHGGHFMIYYTPNVTQIIEGVEIRYFGQQGNLGRYPIHFHRCGAVVGSEVRKNVVRDSKQRCIVIHGTDEVLVEDNVAYNTYGHCFILEDGAEEDNTFQYNLGVRTRSSTYTIETQHNDNECSTFWITNTKNHFIGNVAAGSRMFGFWFETLPYVTGPSADLSKNEDVKPKYLPLYTFKDNTAHSCGRHGVALYSPGWRPSEEAVLENIKSYRNTWEGLLMHGNKNIVVKGGTFSDNRACISYFENPKWNVVQDLECIGRAEVYQDKFGPHCHAWGINNGIKFDFKDDKDIQVRIQNVSFSGFSDPPPGKANCASPGLALRMISFLDSANVKCSGDMPRLDDVSFDTDIDTYDITSGMQFIVKNPNAHNIFIEDDTGVMNPSGQPGFFIQDEEQMTAFIEGSCYPNERSGSIALFCKNVCLRRIDVETYDSEDYRMVVSTSDGDKTFTYERNACTTTKFEAVLPADYYIISFENSTTGDAIVPWTEFSLSRAPYCTDKVKRKYFEFPTSESLLHIRAVDYYEKSGTTENGETMSGFGVGDYVTYGPLDFGSLGTINSIRLYYSKKNTYLDVQFRLDGTSGQVIGKFTPSNTGGAFENTSIPIEFVEGEHYLTFVGSTGTAGIMKWQWFELWGGAVTDREVKD